MQFTLSEHIDAAPAQVFERATDLRKAANVIGGITKVEVLTDGPIRQGTRFRETRIMFKREATEEMEIARFEPPHDYSLLCESHGCRYVTDFHITPDGGGSKIEMVFNAEPLTTMAKVMGFVMKPLLKSCMKETAKDLQDLKRAVEGSSPQAV